MEDFIEIIFGRWLFRFIGARVRYIYYLCIGKKTSLKVLLGEKGDTESQMLNDFANAVVGMIFGLFLFMSIVYVVGTLFFDE